MFAPSAMRAIMRASRNASLRPTTAFARQSIIISRPASRFLSTTSPEKSHTPNAPAAGTTDVNSDVSSVSSIPISPLPPPHLSEAELRVYNILAEELEPSELEVQDISGGCGSMYGIEVVSEKFRGLSMLKQQRMVNAALKELMDREGWHGVQIRTRVE